MKSYTATEVVLEWILSVNGGEGIYIGYYPDIQCYLRQHMTDDDTLKIVSPNRKFPTYKITYAQLVKAWTKKDKAGWPAYGFGATYSGPIIIP